MTAVAFEPYITLTFNNKTSVCNHPDYRLLRRFQPQRVYGPEPENPENAKQALFVDVEATGLDTDSDEIIELGLTPFRFDAKAGTVIDVDQSLSLFEQPFRPIPPEITELTGITPEMVAGWRISDATVETITNGAVLVVAHSARFDRKMLERRFPCFVDKAWGCSQEDVNWRDFGVAGGALVNIAMSACGVFTEGAHRADHDTQLGVHVLATAMHEGQPAMSYLLDSARKPLRRLRALGSPQWTKDWLKAHGYHARYSGGYFDYWYKDFRATATDDEITRELEFCASNAHCEPDVQLISAKHKYSVRA